MGRGMKGDRIRELERAVERVNDVLLELDHDWETPSGMGVHLAQALRAARQIRDIIEPVRA